MTWVRIDDGFFRHRKTIAAGNGAAYLFLAGLAYCNEQLTDGLIPKDAVGMLVKPSKDLPALATRLVEVGYWHDEGSAYRVHDYLHYQKDRDSILAKRRKDSERKKEHRNGPLELRNP